MYINQHHGNYNLTPRGGTHINYFVVHNTATMAPAKNNCQYLASGNAQPASADYFIDTDGTVWEYNDPLSGYYSWHSGDGYGRNGITNNNSMGVEVVSDGRDFTAAQIEALAALYTHMCARVGRELSIVRHFDASGKHCPMAYVDDWKWTTLKNQIKSGTSGWKKDDTGWWYQDFNGSYPVSTWRLINNYWYYFDSRGYACKGWKQVKGEWYYLAKEKTGSTPECAMLTGWVQDKNKWYYLKESGAMVRSCTMEIGGKTYAFDKSGVMFKGSVPTDENGALILT